MNPLLKTNQHLSVNHRGLSKAVSDKRLIKNILINLITNAIKFSDEGSTVHVNVSVTQDAIIFEVIDEGIGIPQDEFEHLFSSFYRARNAVNIQGTGLGLHIVKRYLELLQGNIDVETEVGKGSKFTIQIPHVTD
jgi:signal transduction histidine kinase